MNTKPTKSRIASMAQIQQYKADERFDEEIQKCAKMGIEFCNAHERTIDEASKDADHILKKTNNAWSDWLKSSSLDGTENVQMTADIARHSRITGKPDGIEVLQEKLDKAYQAIADVKQFLPKFKSTCELD